MTLDSILFNEENSTATVVLFLGSAYHRETLSIEAARELMQTLESEGNSFKEYKVGPFTGYEILETEKAPSHANV